jgi:hypothetical protein
MEITLTTPSLLFPAISLLLLAYTNRYLAVANLVRTIRKDYDSGYKHSHVVSQVQSLSKRLEIIRNMQAVGIASLMMASLTMFLLYANLQVAGKVAFGISLWLLMVSMALSFYETVLSNNAIQFEIDDIVHKEKTPKN